MPFHKFSLRRCLASDLLLLAPGKMVSEHAFLTIDANMIAGGTPLRAHFSMAAAQRVVLWFRNDLRLHDNYIVADAMKKISSNRKLEVVPVYCFDPRHFATSQYGPGKCGVIRAQFLRESVTDLKHNLQAIGSDLLVFHGTPETVLPTLMVKDATTTVLAQAEVTDEELRVERVVQRAIKPLGGGLQLMWGATLFHRDDLPFKPELENMPDVFTPFKGVLCEFAPLAPLAGLHLTYPWCAGRAQRPAKRNPEASACARRLRHRFRASRRPLVMLAPLRRLRSPPWGIRMRKQNTRRSPTLAACCPSAAVRPRRWRA